MKKILLIFFVLLFLLGAVGCTDNGVGKTEGTDSTARSDEEITAPDGKTAIVLNGKAVYSIAYPNSATSKIIKAANSLANQIRNQTGVMLSVGQEDGSDGRQILLGRTAYEESRKVIDKLGHKDYSIVSEGEKIVIAGKSEDATADAVDYYIENLLEDNVEIAENGKRTLYFEEYEYKSEVSEMTVNGTNLEKYKIIYASEPAGLSVVANELKQSIEDRYGIKLSVGKDVSFEETEYEILLGKTNRSESRQYYSANPKNIMKYKLQVKDSKMLFICGGAYSCQELVKSFCAEYVKNGKTEISNGEYLTTTLLDKESQAMTDGSTLRVMTSNILNETWATSIYKDIPTATRAEIYAGILSIYQPDFIGVQETDARWQEILPYYLDILKESYDINYTWIHKTQTYNGKTGVNHTSIMYRADKFTLMDSGIKHFSYASESSGRPTIRLVSHAILRSRSGDMYALFNTHFDGNDASNMKRGELSANETAARISEVTAEYGDIPVFCTGDFNFHTNGAYDLFKSVSGLTPSVEAARANGTLVNSITGIGGTMYIDHVFVNSRVQVMRHETVTGNCTGLMSDHLPQYGDYKIKSYGEMSRG